MKALPLWRKRRADGIGVRAGRIFSHTTKSLTLLGEDADILRIDSLTGVGNTFLFGIQATVVFTTTSAFVTASAFLGVSISAWA